jgi:4-diphosphocytidyl-2-C-methyl-D-erythritol kinase
MTIGAVPDGAGVSAPLGSARVTVAAPAKVNLYLEVLGRRADGFHELETIFQTIDLADRVEVVITPHGHGITLVCDRPGIPQGAGNLAWRAASAFVAHRGDHQVGIHVTLTKVIPHGAGLGGGSSDAAAVLRALDRLLPGWLTPAELHDVAAGLGSDVPYFLLGGTAWGGGRGERLVSLPELPELPVTVLMPAAMLPTPAVFAALSAEERTERPAHGDRWWSAAMTHCDAGRLATLMRNRLTAPARRLCPELERLVLWLEDAGIPSVMSGSGSSCVALGMVEPPHGVQAWKTTLRTRARLDVL